MTKQTKERIVGWLIGIIIIFAIIMFFFYTNGKNIHVETGVDQNDVEILG